MQQPIVGYGLCQCGCGWETNLAPGTNTARGLVKGEPMRFRRFHRTGSGPVAFWANVQKGGDDDCWPWTGARDAKGYGRFRSLLVTRLLLAPVPDGLHVLHRCDNPPCCNPAHLFLGTHADNMADMGRKGRRIEKLSAEDVRAIRQLLGVGHRHRDIADRFGVTRQMISLIAAGKARIYV